MLRAVGELILELSQTLPDSQLDHGHALIFALTVDVGRAVRLGPVFSGDEAVLGENRSSGFRGGPVVWVKHSVTSHATSLRIVTVWSTVDPGLTVLCLCQQVAGECGCLRGDLGSLEYQRC